MPTTKFSRPHRLSIVGAGPKGLAVGLRAHVYKEFGFKVPEINIIERSEIAAHWTGRHGFTNGQLSLGTSPEKDLGFPYENDGSPISTAINNRLQNFSWRSYLIRQGRYANWVDRGSPQPTHEQWGAYMKFVAEEISPSVNFITAEVEQATPLARSWNLKLKQGSTVSDLVSDSLMLTGPAVPRMPACFPSEKIFNMANVWQNLGSVPRDQALRIAVVGNGETAASVLIALGKKNFPLAEVEVIAPQGVIFTRGESFLENRFYSTSHLTQWKQMRLEDRQTFIRRTDIGVFSPGALAELRHEEFTIVAGRGIGARNHEQKVALDVEYDGAQDTRIYDYVIFASGLNHTKLLERLLGPEGMSHVLASTGNEKLEQAIESDMSVRALEPKLYLPMLAGLAQGPGFANLSCLGLLAARILDPLVARKSSSKRESKNDRARETFEGNYETRYRLHTA